MGLASWANRKPQDAASWYFGASPLDTLQIGRNFHHHVPCMQGNIYDGTFQINWSTLEQLSHPNTFGSHPERFDYFANLANSVQTDLETCSLSFLQSLQQATNAKQLVFTGGVALNSVLNGKIMASGVFDDVFIPPAPGDEGIALGCAMFGYHQVIIIFYFHLCLFQLVFIGLLLLYLLLVEKERGIAPGSGRRKGESTGVVSARWFFCCHCCGRQHQWPRP
jgi:hypothetical protein